LAGGVATQLPAGQASCSTSGGSGGLESALDIPIYASIKDAYACGNNRHRTSALKLDK
jgi:hypothetical protein